MALPDRVRGGIRPSQSVTWKRESGEAEDLTGATITGVIRNRATGATRAIAGTLALTDASAGGLRWDMAAADVAESGSFDVQFTATFAAGLSPARTFVERWTVAEALAVSA